MLQRMMMEQQMLRACVCVCVCACECVCGNVNVCVCACVCVCRGCVRVAGKLTLFRRRGVKLPLALCLLADPEELDEVRLTPLDVTLMLSSSSSSSLESSSS